MSAFPLFFLSDRVPGLVWFGSIYLVTTAGFVEEQLIIVALFMYGSMALVPYIITTLLTMYYRVFCYVWWLCMAINISVQYNGGLLPDIILLLTQGYDDRGIRLNTIQRFCLYSL